MGLSQATLELLVNLKDNASSGLSSIGSALGGVGVVAGGVALAGVAAITAGIAGGLTDALGARALLAETENIIRNTGGAAGITAQEVTDLASSLSDAAGKSLFGDDQIQGATNVLLKYKELKGIVPEVTQLSVDMAQTLGTDPAAAAEALGRALQNPFEASAKLAKQGIMLTDAQNAQIEAFKAAGDVTGAQTFLMDQLNSTYAGSAQSAAKAAGGMVQFQAGLGETFETIATQLLPILDKFGEWLTSPEVQGAIEFLAASLADGIGAVVTWLSETAIPFLMQAWADMEPTIMKVVAFIQSDVVPILQWIGEVLIAGLIVELKALGWVWENFLLPALKVVWNFIVTYVAPAIETIYKALRDDLPKGIAVAVLGFENIKTALGNFKTTYLDPIAAGWKAISDGISEAFDWIGKISSSIGSITIPSWLQGHSPPPLANWFSDIAGAAEDAGGAVGAVAPPDGTIPSFGASGAGAGAGGVTVYVTVQGSVSTERDLVLAIRDGLNQIGRQNLTIFSEQVTP